MQPLRVRAAGGATLAAHLYPADGPTLVVALGALGAPQRYLRHVAAWLAGRGWPVLTFDYAGVGESGAAGAPTTNLDRWADDVRAVLEHARGLGQARVLGLAHSIGGVLLGHSGAGQAVDGALLVASTHGVPALYRGRGRLLIEAAYTGLPAIARALGELPPWPWLLGARVPRDVVVQWVRWGRERRIATWTGEDSAPAFARCRAPLLGVAIADDARYAPCAAVDALLARFTAAGVRRELLDPVESARAAGEPRAPLRHFGLFREDAPAWSRRWLLRRLEDLDQAARGGRPGETT